jgi:hypothetical protein
MSRSLVPTRFEVSRTGTCVFRFPGTNAGPTTVAIGVLDASIVNVPIALPVAEAPVPPGLPMTGFDSTEKMLLRAGREGQPGT